jgi:hypothetical protein
MGIKWRMSFSFRTMAGCDPRWRDRRQGGKIKRRAWHAD